MKQVTILFMEEDAAFLAAQAGEADLVYTSATYSDQSIDGYSLVSYASVDNRGLTCRLQKRQRMRKEGQREMI